MLPSSGTCELFPRRFSPSAQALVVRVGYENMRACFCDSRLIDAYACGSSVYGYASAMQISKLICAALGLHCLPKRCCSTDGTPSFQPCRSHLEQWLCHNFCQTFAKLLPHTCFTLATTFAIHLPQHLSQKLAKFAQIRWFNLVTSLVTFFVAAFVQTL